jgi:hypothetical protein
MPVHDWTRVEAGTFHAFHTAWITHLSETLNGGVLPSGYYAMPEQHAGRSIADVLTLHSGDASHSPPPPQGGLTVAEAPPRVSRRQTIVPSTASRRRTLTVRHVSGHRIVAMIEIVSPANKDRARHVEDLAEKVASALEHGVHVLLVDLLPPGPYDREGIHGAVLQQLNPDAKAPTTEANAPLTVASYVAGPEVDVYSEPLGLGDDLPEMPLFLDPDRYIRTPLEPTYEAAYRGMPQVWRDVLNP